MTRFPWNSHLSEERLFECYLAERSIEGVDPRAADHLADCAPCREQYTALVGMMDETFAEAARETAAVFTPERLHVQREQIARRLELIDHPARVISFRAASDLSDGASPMKGLRTMTARIAAGWMAAAAAMGLFVGASAGFLYESRAHVSTAAATGAGAAVTNVTNSANGANVANGGAVESPAQDAASRVETTPTALEDDSRLMSELEAAHERPRTQELLAIDTMTPHVREISYRVR